MPIFPALTVGFFLKGWLPSVRFIPFKKNPTASALVLREFAEMG